jgi:hypothetical protein
MNFKKYKLTPCGIGVDSENGFCSGPNFCGSQQKSPVATGGHDDIGPIGMLVRVVVPLNDPAKIVKSKLSPSILLIYLFKLNQQKKNQI